MSGSDWLDPNWRHEVSNQVLAWLCVTAIGAMATLAWWSARQIPKVALLPALAIGALLSVLVGLPLTAAIWVLTHRTHPAVPEDIDRQGSRRLVETPAQIQEVLRPVENLEYRNAVAEVIQAFEPRAYITVGGEMVGPDGARTVDIQLWSAADAASAPTLIDVIARRDEEPVGIQAVDAAESKRRDLRAAAILLCSNSGFDASAIRKANAPVLV